MVDPPALLCTPNRALRQRTFHVLIMGTYHVLTTCPSISMDNRGDLGVACGVSADGGVGCLAFWDRVTEAFFQIRSVRSSFFGCNHSICIKANNGHPARWLSS